MNVSEIYDVCGDYAIDIKSGVLNRESLTLYFNSRKNAEMVKYIIETDSSVPNVATVADVKKVKHGKWSRGTEPSGSVYAHCSACNRKMNSFCYGYAHCPLCGARMDGDT